MKASKAAVGETYTLHVKDVHDEPMHDPDTGAPVQIVVYGPGSAPYRKAKSDQQNRGIALLQKRGGAKQTPEAKAKEQAEFLADLTVEIRNFEADGPDGSPLTGRANAIAIYSDPGLGYIAEQVHEAAHNWANFSKASPTV